eukprot:61946-Rhodomonas_salina.1
MSGTELGCVCVCDAMSGTELGCVCTRRRFLALLPKCWARYAAMRCPVLRLRMAICGLFCAMVCGTELAYGAMECGTELAYGAIDC